ncbi:WD40 repeat domain-containing serine/threonine protein kinase [Streptomyces sp. NPDC089919]|uniref:WD40 repeat domain-containing serine/threonine protein kinase n=1 Tax=Streptomyces sp. NPDC089919 TaxID=3155188 RepID=UPI0034337C87
MSTDSTTGTPVSAPTDPLTPDDPQRIGGYWLAARLGAGGQGVVYEAYDAAGARVALKVLHRDADPFVRDRFGKEAEAAQRVAPFCTARVLDAAVDGDVPYLVSEYVPGPTLAAEVRARGPLAEDAALRLATGAATALAAIHRAGVVHRDLKPGNVLLGPDGPRIIDFGIARAPDMSLTATGAMMGTFGYMAPEVLHGKRATTAADVFAWGAVVLYAATGAEPFRGANIAEVAHRTTEVDPDLSGLPARLRPLIAAALAKDPQARPTAKDLLSGLVDAATDRPVEDPRTASADPRTVPDPRTGADSLGLLRAGARQADAGSGTAAVPPLGDRAEAAYAALPEDARQAAHDLLLRLVLPGGAADGSQDTVRTAGPDELFADRPESEQRATARAAEALTAAGALVTEHDGAVRPVTPALLPAWRRLRAWTDADRTGIGHRQRITWAAHRWTGHGRRTEDLLTGSDLRTLLDWLPTTAAHLRPSPPELDFLDASRTEAARTVRRKRQLLAGLAGVTVLALVAGGVAYLQNRESELRKNQATARAVAQAADSLRGTEPDTAMLLGLAAYRISPVPEARAALNASAVQRERASIRLPAANKEDGDDSGRAYAPGGTHVLSYGPGGAQWWDLTKGAAGMAEPLLTFPAGRYLVEKGGALSPDGKLLLVKTDGAYRILSTKDGRPVGTPISVSSDEEPMDVLNTGHVELMDQRTGVYRLVDRTGRPAPTWDPSATVAPDAGHFAYCNRTSPLRVTTYDDPGTTVISRSAGGVLGNDCQEVRFSPDGRYLAEITTGSRTYVWDLRTHRLQATLVAEGTDLQFSSAGHYLVGPTDDKSAHPGMLEVWDARTDGKQPLVRIPLPARQADDADDVFRAYLDEDAKLLRYEAARTEQLKVVDVAAVLDVGTGPAADGSAEGAALSPDGTAALVRTVHGLTATLQPVDPATGKPAGAPVTQRTTEGIFPWWAALSDGGRVLAYSDVTRERREFVARDQRTGAELARFPYVTGNIPNHLGISPDGRYLTASFANGSSASSDGWTTVVWDVRGRREVRKYTATAGHGVFSPDSSRLITGAGDDLDLATGHSRPDAFGKGRYDYQDLAFAADGDALALRREDGWIEVWDGAARERRVLLPSSLVRGGGRYQDEAGQLAFTPDGGQLALVVGGDSVQLWDVGARLALGSPLNITGRPLDAMAFAGGSLRTLSGGLVHDFDLDPDHLAAQVCARAGRDITPEEWATYIPDAPYRGLC